MNNIKPNGYTQEATAMDKILDDRIADIRRQQDAGLISVRQAADMRVEALAHHLAVLKALRAEYFGNGDDE